MGVSFTLTDAQEAFLDWLTDPERAGKDPTKSGSVREYSRISGVNEKSLYKWRKNPIFIKKWEERVLSKHGAPDRLENIMEVLYVKALEGDVRAIELHMKLMDRMRPDKLQVIQAEQTLEEMTDEQLREEELKLIGAERARRGAAPEDDVEHTAGVATLRALASG